MFSVEDAAQAWQLGVEDAYPGLESLMESGIVGLSDAEVGAQGSLLEIPPLLHASARQMALLEQGRKRQEPVDGKL